jgi:DNA-binding GntR family transcriptional regulator
MEQHIEITQALMGQDAELAELLLLQHVDDFQKEIKSAL